MKRNDEERQLTKAEMEIMNVLWNAKGMTTHEIIEEYPEPKPAYSTFFGNSLKSMLSYFAQHEEVSEEDLQEIMEMIKK